MRRIVRLLSVCLCGVCFTDALRAAEPPLEFLHALQQNGYPDLAVTYLKSLQASKKMPDVLREVWDLEMAKSLQELAKTEDRQRAALMAEAEKHLNKFLKEKPKHPQAVSAMVAWGNFLLDRGTQLLRTAPSLGDKEKKQAYADAQKLIQDAKPKYLDAAKKFQARLAAIRVPEAPATAAEKSAAAQLAREQQETQNDWLNARFQAALCDYYLGQTYPNPKDPKRKESLLAAAKGFDALWQGFRLTLSGLYAHMWHGRTMDDLGNLTTALDIYEEVLANLADPNERAQPTGLEPLFTQVQFFRLQILAKQQRPSDFMPEIIQWLEDYAKLKDTDGYQGVMLEAAKIRLRQAEKAPAAERQRYNLEAARLLADAARVRSAYQSEAILLRRSLTRADTSIAQVNNFDEAVAIGSAAAVAEKWVDAAAAYARALELSASVTDAQRVSAVKQQLGLAKLMLAQGMFNEGQYLECFAAAEKLMSEYETGPQGPAAAVLAIKAALNAVSTVPAADQLAAVERLEKIATHTVNTWPSKAEADEGRVALGQARLFRGDINGALDFFAKVDANSDRYPLALLISAQTLHRRHQMAKATSAAGRKVDAKQMATDLEQAEKALSQSLQLQRKTAEAGAPMPRQLVETQLLLAEVHLENGRNAEAQELLTPLVAEVQRDKPKELDNTTLRILLRALQVNCALGDRDNADIVASLLLKIGPDNPFVNLGLLDYVKLLRNESEKAELAVNSPPDPADSEAVQAAKKKLADDKKAFRGLLKTLAQRQNNPVTGMVFVADANMEAGQAAEAKALYERVLAMAATDPQAKKAETRVRSQLVGLLRKQGKFEEALQQADELVKSTQGRALEPLMEQARIRQIVAEKDPSQYEEALKHWARLRNLLHNLRKRPPEYFEVCYHAAQCLVESSKHSSDREAAKKSLDDAEKLLKATLVLSPQLNGPAMVGQYNDLLERIRREQGKPE